MIDREFEPSVPPVTAEEMRRAYHMWKLAHDSGQEAPDEVYEIWNRRDQVAREYSKFVRDDTAEIVEKMLPAGTPLTMARLMDILHVYYWWSLDESSPVDCMEEFLKDLDDGRFAEAVEVIHDEFRDRCYRHTKMGP